MSERVPEPVPRPADRPAAGATAPQVRVTAEETLQRARELPPAALGAVAVVVVLVAVLLIRSRRRSTHL